MMTDNQCLGITLMQMFNQFSQSYLLCFRPGILRSLSVGIQTTYIAYTYTVTVVALQCAPIIFGGRPASIVPSVGIT